jgi:hypothetical protein
MVAATWPVGIVLTSWDYMWRTTVLHRSEKQMPAPAVLPILLTYPADLSPEELQTERDGHGPLFLRRYQTSIRDSRSSATEVMAAVTRNLNRPAPTSFARFEKVKGEAGQLVRGDEFVIRMPGPWDGPVRVIDVTPCSFRLATLRGHLEAGQIEFRIRVADHHKLRFEIESLTRSGAPVVDLLYRHLRIAKEVQAHMWISFLEGVVKASGGRMCGGVTIVTDRIEDAASGR